MSEHTPGPWAWERHPDFPTKFIALSAQKSPFEDVLLCTGDEETAWGDIKSADAALICAAPDLLSVLLLLTRDDRFQMAIGGNPNAVAGLLAQIDAAIIKAEGRQGGSK